MRFPRSVVKHAQNSKRVRFSIHLRVLGMFSTLLGVEQSKNHPKREWLPFGDDIEFPAQSPFTWPLARF